MASPFVRLIVPAMSLLTHIVHQLLKEKPFYWLPNSMFNIQWHYALDITNNSDNVAYVCPKSIWSTRSIMTENDLYGPVFDAVGDEFAKVFEVDASLPRIDSVHIFSNMRHLGRNCIFVATIKKFLPISNGTTIKTLMPLRRNSGIGICAKKRKVVFQWSNRPNRPRRCKW